MAGTLHRAIDPEWLTAHVCTQVHYYTTKCTISSTTKQLKFQLTIQRCSCYNLSRHSATYNSTHVTTNYTTLTTNYTTLGAIGAGALPRAMAMLSTTELSILSRSPHMCTPYCFTIQLSSLTLHVCTPYCITGNLTSCALYMCTPYCMTVQLKVGLALQLVFNHLYNCTTVETTYTTLHAGAIAAGALSKAMAMLSSTHLSIRGRSLYMCTPNCITIQHSVQLTNDTTCVQLTVLLNNSLFN